MRIALIGVGGAGTRIVDNVLEYQHDAGRAISDGHVLALDTDRESLDALTNVDEDRRVLLGELHPDVDGDGTYGDVDLGVEVAREDLDEVRRALDPLPAYDLDAIVLAAGLAGGTGSGVGAVLLEELDALFDQPVYALGVFPTDADGDDAALTAARSLRTLVPRATNLIGFDNEAWYSTDLDEAANRRTANAALAMRLVTAFGGGADHAAIPENCIDPSDIVRTLDTGGVSTIGYAATDLDTGSWLVAWLRRLLRRPAVTDPVEPSAVKDLVRRAVTSRLTLPCDVSSAERIAVIVAGPPDALSRKGFENGRRWLEEETGTVEIRAGDEPRPGSSSLTAVVLLSNVTAVDRIEALKDTAVGAHRDRSEAEFGFDAAETT